MRLTRCFWLLFAIMAGQSVNGREIVVGVEPVPIKKVAILFTPVVLPDLISAKAAVEYRLSRKFNVVFPLEAKWMDYHRVIKLAADVFDVKHKDIPERWYRQGQLVRPLWNIDFAQLKVSSGIGVKWFPISESMANAFFLKTLAMAGIEQFYQYRGEGKKMGAVFTHVFTLGYNWVKLNRFTFGFEVGEEYTFHVNPIKELPILIDGIMPIVQFSLGFTI